MNKTELLRALAERFAEDFGDIKVTNGDVIKAVFPNALRSDYIENDMTIIYLQDENESEMVVPEDWWNASYNGRK